MADVRLDFYDLDADALPDVCMKCGAASTVRPVRNFSWTPYWARFMPPIIAVWFIKRRRVPVPLCEQHKNHWSMRYLIGIGGIVLAALLFVVGIVMAASDDGGPGQVLGMLLMAVGGVVFVAWLIAMIVLGVSGIGVTEITDDAIVLRNVSPNFTQAYRDHTSGEIDPRAERAGREPWAGGAGARRGRDADQPPDDKYRRR